MQKKEARIILFCTSAIIKYIVPGRRFCFNPLIGAFFSNNFSANRTITRPSACNTRIDMKPLHGDYQPIRLNANNKKSKAPCPSIKMKAKMKKGWIQIPEDELGNIRSSSLLEQRNPTIDKKPMGPFRTTKDNSKQVELPSESEVSSPNLLEPLSVDRNVLRRVTAYCTAEYKLCANQ